jgi:hypothetical protein
MEREFICLTAAVLETAAATPPIIKSTRKPFLGVLAGVAVMIWLGWLNW